MHLETYGLPIRPDAPRTGTYRDQLEVEFAAFRMGLTEEQGGLGKAGHFKKIVDLIWNNDELKCPKRFIHNPWSDQFFEAVSNEKYVGVAGSASSGKSDGAALWALVNYLADPTHTKILVLSTTIAGAKMRIWKTLMEYWQGIANQSPPGKLLQSNNMVKGPSYDMMSLTEASGIQLLASEKSKEKEALDKIIGIKAPKTDAGEYRRVGKLILIIDEMTGATESILHAAYANLDSNENFQMIGLGNPSSLFDTFGLFCEPDAGWDSINEDTYEWKTSRGVCIRFNAEQNPRIIHNDERLVWMPTQAKIDQAIRDYGSRSLFFNRMFKAVFTKEGDGQTVYSAADFIAGKAFDKVTWGTRAPTPLAFLDPSFSEGGDRCMLTFGLYGINSDGVPVLCFDGTESLHIDVSSQEVPHNYQIARKFRDMCQQRGVRPEHAGFDSTGAGGPFGDIVASEWSPLVKRVNFSGSPSSRPVSPTNRTSSKDFYANKVTEIWYSAKPLIAAGQIKKVSNDFAKEVCVRENFKGVRGEDTRKLKVESKRDMKVRTGESPDLGDSGFGLIDICRTVFGFKKTIIQEPQLSAFSPSPQTPVSSFAAFAKKTSLSNKTLT